ncbi:DUF3892 domain-containing protein [Paraburkholderia youngii]|uniref:DUF3892 domain-containing protein n=1 Tax=Paraburkholderia youngii TaxID=2782701 RepID=A0A7Y6K8D9_9BURK|nr:DUF3892 domain-containing protein [Paraburkholderia youngii]NUY05781.1 DUF3892 domain-containing protein [Paraburkholderia youngii]
MAMRIEVFCISKTNKESRHEAISHIGGKNADGSRWKISEKDAVKGIETGKWNFYVGGDGQTADVLVWQTPQGHKFLRTGRDLTTADDLLSLPECPINASPCFQLREFPVSVSAAPSSLRR